MKLRRNDPCHCGSGKKYKKCCLEKDLEMQKEEEIVMEKIDKANAFSDMLLKTKEGKKLLNIIAKLNPEIRNKMVLDMAKEFPKEVEMFFRRTAENDSSADNILSYGYILSDTNKPKEAIEQFKKAIYINKNNLDAYYALAQEYDKIGMLELAEDCYKHILTLDKDDKGTLWKYFGVLVKQEKYDLLVEESKKFLNEDMDNLIVAYFLLEVSALKDDEDTAKSAILNFFSITVTDPEEKKWYNNIMNEMRKKFNLNIENDAKFPTKEELLESLKEEDIDEVLQEYMEMFSLFPHINFTNFCLAILYELKSNIDKSVFHYSKALEATNNVANRVPAYNLKNSFEEIERALDMAISKQKVKV